MERCEAIILETKWMEETEKHCKHNARVKIDGKVLCIKHAGRVAVRLALKHGLAEKLPVDIDDI